MSLLQYCKLHAVHYTKYIVHGGRIIKNILRERNQYFYPVILILSLIITTILFFYLGYVIRLEHNILNMVLRTTIMSDAEQTRFFIWRLLLRFTRHGFLASSIYTIAKVISDYRNST